MDNGDYQAIMRRFNKLEEMVQELITYIKKDEQSDKEFYSKFKGISTVPNDLWNNPTGM